MFFAVPLYLFLLGFSISTAQEWSYKNADKWSESFPKCKGSRQSPIDIDLLDTNTVSESRRNSSMLIWNNYMNLPSKISLTNNGRTLELNATWKDESEIPFLSGGPFEKDEYVFQAMKFHWGATNDRGSGHTFSKSTRKTPLEVHFTHAKREYGSIAEALKHPDGIAAFAFVFVLEDEKAEGFSQPMSMQEIVDAIPKVISPGSSTEIKPFPLGKMTALKHLNSFLSYSGSLVIPPCVENVLWMIPFNVIHVTADQMTKFRLIKLMNGDDHNNRPTQPLNGRILYTYGY